MDKTGSAKQATARDLSQNDDPLQNLKTLAITVLLAALSNAAARSSLADRPVEAATLLPASPTPPPTSVATKPTRVADHRYGSNRSLDPPI